MGFFYFDESIHKRGGFVLGAFVYSERELDGPVESALRQAGLVPSMEEFKSGARMDQRPEQKTARELLYSVFCDYCRVGVVVAPHQQRESFGQAALDGLTKILSNCNFESRTHDVFFDQGVPIGRSAALGAKEALFAGQQCRFHVEQDSVRVLGIQVADLIAHTCATMLLGQLGIVTKTVKAGEDSGYAPDLDIGLDSELWAGVRWNFFAVDPPPIETWKSPLDFQIDVESRGLHISQDCDPIVRQAALARFGKMYVGCIH